MVRSPLEVLRMSSMKTHLELELEDGHDVLLVVVDLAGPLEAGLHVRPELFLQQLIDSRPGVNVIKQILR
jgi:hypothetical protein